MVITNFNNINHNSNTVLNLRKTSALELSGLTPEDSDSTSAGISEKNSSVGSQNSSPLSNLFVDRDSQPSKYIQAQKRASAAKNEVESIYNNKMVRTFNALSAEFEANLNGNPNKRYTEALKNQHRVRRALNAVSDEEVVEHSKKNLDELKERIEENAEKAAQNADDTTTSEQAERTSSTDNPADMSENSDLSDNAVNSQHDIQKEVDITLPDVSFGTDEIKAEMPDIDLTDINAAEGDNTPTDIEKSLASYAPLDLYV